MESAKKAKKSDVWQGGGAAEEEMLIRLGGLMVKTRSSFEALERELTGEEREQVLDAINRFETLTGEGVEELRGCAEALERALRLLEAVRLRR